MATYGLMADYALGEAVDEMDGMAIEIDLSGVEAEMAQVEAELAVEAAEEHDDHR